MKCSLCLALICAASTLIAQSPSPWNGTWKLDRSKSHLTGETYTLSINDKGMWTITQGPLTFSYAPDGKPYPILDKDHTVIAILVDSRTLKSINQFKGKTTSTATDILSPDGKTFSDVTINTREDGSTYTTTETDTRTTPGTGFAGTWTSTQTSSSSDAPFTIKVSDDSFSLSDPAQKLTFTGKLDGTPAIPVSPDTTTGITWSYKRLSSTRIGISSMLNGKKISEGYDQLSNDGSSYTNVTWLMGKESEKTTKFYVKQ